MLEAASSTSGHTVSAALDRVIADGPTPRSITVDHGTEFMSRTLEDWAYHCGVQLDFIRPGKPVENAFGHLTPNECVAQRQAMRTVEEIAFSS